MLQHRAGPPTEDAMPDGRSPCPDRAQTDGQHGSGQACGGHQRTTESAGQAVQSQSEERLPSWPCRFDPGHPLHRSPAGPFGVADLGSAGSATVRIGFRASSQRAGIKDPSGARYTGRVRLHVGGQVPSGQARAAQDPDQSLSGSDSGLGRERRGVRDPDGLVRRRTGPEPGCGRLDAVRSRRGPRPALAARRSIRSSACRRRSAGPGSQVMGLLQVGRPVLLALCVAWIKEVAWG